MQTKKQGTVVTYKEILAESPKYGFSRREYEHLHSTWKSLTRFQAAKIPNPRFVQRFVENERAFADWSRKNGFALSKELELIGPYQVEGTRLIFKHEKEWVGRGLQIDREYRLFQEEDGEVEITPEHWVTDFRDLRWVPRDTLARRKDKPLLTSYGKGRLKERRKPLMLTFQGETKSASAWSKDSRCAVSDKIIKDRKEKGWSDEEAITLPRGAEPLK